MSKFIWDSHGNKINVSKIEKFSIQKGGTYGIYVLISDIEILISEHVSEQEARNKIDELTMSDFDSIKPMINNMLDTIILNLHGPMEH